MCFVFLLFPKKFQSNQIVEWTRSQHFGWNQIFLSICGRSRSVFHFGVSFISLLFTELFWIVWLISRHISVTQQNHSGKHLYISFLFKFTYSSAFTNNYRLVNFDNIPSLPALSVKLFFSTVTTWMSKYSTMSLRDWPILRKLSPDFFASIRMAFVFGKLL